MTQVFLVAIGGALGAVSRYLLIGLTLQASSSASFPFPTFLVNVIGCALAGLLLGLTSRLGWLTVEWQLFLLTGILGGFTTFSAFGLEIFSLIKRGLWSVALAYSVLSVVVGIGALAVAAYAAGANQ